ncbi:MAG TPA: recombinase family protein [Candidatus Acidoferrales bacterium]|nr:recombinase family protein [Candidatus Acidoferrales bacterium]
MRAAIYARVSTANNGQDPTMQTRELEEFCQRRGWEISDQYVDQGVSGAKDSRPELNRLMADAHLRRFDVLTVWKFDRFARSVSHLLLAMMQQTPWSSALSAPFTRFLPRQPHPNRRTA